MGVEFQKMLQYPKPLGLLEFKQKITHFSLLHCPLSRVIVKQLACLTLHEHVTWTVKPCFIGQKLLRHVA